MSLVGTDEERVIMEGLTGGTLDLVGRCGRLLDLDLVGSKEEWVSMVRRFGKGSAGRDVSAARRNPTAALASATWWISASPFKLVIRHISLVAFTSTAWRAITTSPALAMRCFPFTVSPLAIRFFPLTISDLAVWVVPSESS